MSKNQNISLPHILVVDDEPSIRRALRDNLETEGYRVSDASDGKECLAKVAENADIDTIILDISMKNGMNGDETLVHLNENHPDIPVIMFSAFSDIETVVQMMQKGAHNFLPKPPKQGELQIAVQLALQRRKTLRTPIKNNSTQTKVKSINQKKTSHNPTVIVGNSSVMNQLKNQLEKVAACDVDVLLLGESGTGKSLAAKWIHENSSRSNGPFITANVTAIADGMFEGEVFGSKKGSYTSSNKDIRGYFELAEGGTLFLDEIGNLPTAFQQKLLNALGDRKFKSYGDDNFKPFDCRVITATNRNLKIDVQNGDYMIDMYFRIAHGVVLTVPALRERGSDILQLIKYYGQAVAEKFNKSPLIITDEAYRVLEKHYWPGNVREIEAVVVTLNVFHSGETIDKETVRKVLDEVSIGRATLKTAGQS